MEHTRIWFDNNKFLYQHLLIKCACCNESVKDITLHHIVPLALGGTNYITNIAGLCNKCHSKIHGKRNILSRELQKKGIAIAKAQGKHLGRPKAEYPVNWTEIYIQWKAKNITASKAMELLNLRKNTFYKLVKQYEE